jgi:hypothetical protein
VGEGFAAALMGDGRVLAGGGLFFPPNIPTWFPIPDAYAIDPATGAPDGYYPMVWARAYHTATTLDDGRVLVAGGWGDTAEIFAPLVVTDQVFVPAVLWIVD